MIFVVQNCRRSGKKVLVVDIAAEIEIVGLFVAQQQLVEVVHVVERA